MRMSKAVINDTTYSQVEQQVESFDLSKIVNKISNYIKTSLGGDEVDF